MKKQILLLHILELHPYDCSVKHWVNLAFCQPMLKLQLVFLVLYLSPVLANPNLLPVFGGI